MSVCLYVWLAGLLSAWQHVCLSVSVCLAVWLSGFLSVCCEVACKRPWRDREHLLEVRGVVHHDYVVFSKYFRNVLKPWVVQHREETPRLRLGGIAIALAMAASMTFCLKSRDRSRVFSSSSLVVRVVGSDTMFTRRRAI